MSKQLFRLGAKLGRKHFELINARGGKWKDRHVPIFIRQNLMIPWYITIDQAGKQILFVIQYPERGKGKVCFVNIESIHPNATATKQAKRLHSGGI
jgi:hypothetical protein